MLPDTVQFMSYSERSQLATHPLTIKLLSLMDSKETNLALSADVKTTAELLKVCVECVVTLFDIV